MSAPTVYCRQCGNALLPDDQFCSKCGAPQHPEANVVSKQSHPGGSHPAGAQKEIDHKAVARPTWMNVRSKQNVDRRYIKSELPPPAEPEYQEPTERKQASNQAIGCLALILLCVVAGVLGNIWGDDDESGQEVDLNLSLRLWGDAAGNTSFGQTCSGSGEYDFLGPQTKVTISHEGKQLLSTTASHARGGDRGECDVFFRGNIKVANGYDVTFSSGGDSISTSCRANQVPVTEFDHKIDVAFMKVDIRNGEIACVRG